MKSAINFAGGTPLDTQFTFCNSIGDEEIPDFAICLVRLLLEALTIFLKKNRTLVVLIQDVLVDVISLGFQELTASKEWMALLDHPLLLSSLSVELLVFNFCLVEVTIGHPRPNVTAPPV